mgnify:CR=1 FL=1
MRKLYTSSWSDYELLDAGGGKKLERWGTVITIRPEVQAYFKSEKPFDAWRKMAHWEFVSKGAQSGSWQSLKKNAPSNWSIHYKRHSFELQLTKFKHVGLFPEQAINWQFIQEKLNDEGKLLNLFAYTGAASIAARSTGAETLHVDSVKQLISWAKTNMIASDLDNIKWVHEDALKFASREVKRGNKFDGIVMDPPAWGIGAKKEKWKLEDKLDELMRTAKKLLTQKGFLILNTYSPKIQIERIEELAQLYFPDRNFEVKELWMKTTSGKELYFGNLLRVF